MTTFTHLSLQRGTTALLTLAAAVTTVVACSDAGPTQPALQCSATAVSITPDAAQTVYVSDSLALSARPQCADGTASVRPVSWVSTDPSVASVSSRGTVKGLQPGVTTIKAFSGTTYDAVSVTVVHRISDILVVPASVTLRLNTQLQLTAVVRSGETVLEGRSVTWASSDNSVLAVTPAGLATALAEGTATVSASSEGQTGTATIAVRAQAASVALDPVSLALFEGDEATLTATVRDPSGLVLDREPTWATSNPTIATVAADGSIQALRQGLAVITATYEGVTGSAVVLVQAHVARVLVTPTETLLAPAQTAQLTAMAFDARGTLLERPVEWTSADSSVATVTAGGLVTGVDEGTTLAIATVEGVQGIVTVVVQQPVTEVLLEPAAATLIIGETLQVSANPRDYRGRGLNRPIGWSSDRTDIATVSASGLVTAVKAGVAQIGATAGGTTGRLMLTVRVGVTSLRITNGAHTMGVGERLPLSVELIGQDGQPVVADVQWTSADTSVATVDAAGSVTALVEGSVLIRAESEEKTDSITLAVGEPAAALVITKVDVDEEDRPVMVGGTMQLAATVLGGSGNELADRHVSWASSDEALATIDRDGLVSGIARGIVTITARSGNASGTLELRVSGSGSGSGGGEEGLGNNLSVPVIFAEGIGLTLLPSITDPGLRPLAEEGVVPTSNPFWYEANVPDCEIYYCQKGVNTWRAEWLDGTAGIPRSAFASFGDNLTHRTWNTHAPIRIEIALWDQGGNLQGFEMPYSVGSEATEMYGTNGVLAAMQPTIYSPTARLVLQKLTNYNPNTGQGDVAATVTDVALWENLGAEGPGQFKAEVNVAGRVILGYSLTIRDLVLPTDVEKYGWWRIMLVLDSEANIGGTWLPRNTSLDGLVIPTVDSEPLLYTPKLDTATQRVWLDIYVESASGGGGHAP